MMSLTISSFKHALCISLRLYGISCHTCDNEYSSRNDHVRKSAKWEIIFEKEDSKVIWPIPCNTRSVFSIAKRKNKAEVSLYRM